MVFYLVAQSKSGGGGSPFLFVTTWVNFCAGEITGQADFGKNYECWQQGRSLSSGTLRRMDLNVC